MTVYLWINMGNCDILLAYSIEFVGYLFCPAGLSSVGTSLRTIPIHADPPSWFSLVPRLLLDVPSLDRLLPP